MSASFLSGSVVPKKISACTAHAEEFYASIMLSCFGCDSRIHGWFFIIAVLPCSCNSSPAGSVFRYLGDGLRLQIANCASRSAPFPRRSLGAGRRRQIQGRGGFRGARVGRGISEAIVSRRWSGATRNRSIFMFRSMLQGHYNSPQTSLLRIVSIISIIVLKFLKSLISFLSSHTHLQNSYLLNSSVVIFLKSF